MARTVRLSSKEGSALAQKSNSLSSALASLGLKDKIVEPVRKRPKAQQPTVVAPETPSVKKKRQGVVTAPIFKSLDTALPTAVWNKDTLALDIPGGRILTYNELYSILQYRKHEVFRYKKICRSVIERALNTPNPSAKPYFDGPTRLTLLRVGSKEMDLDALPVVFKYFLDSFRREGVIADDNPNIIVDVQFVQGVGEPRLGMKLERLKHWEKAHIPSWEQWSAMPKADTTKTSTKKTSKKKDG